MNKITPDSQHKHPIQLYPASANSLCGIVACESRPIRISGAAMVYTVTICLLVSMVLASMVMLFGYTKLANNQVYFQELAQDNLESGKALALYGPNSGFGEFSGALFDSRIDSYYVSMKRFGLYGIMVVEGVHGPARAQKVVLFGQRASGNFRNSLCLEDRNRPLNLVGNTLLQGSLCLPDAGLRRGIVGRRTFERERLFQGNIVNAKGNSYEVDYTNFEEVAKRLTEIQNTSISSNWRPTDKDIISGSWGKPTIELRSNGKVTLDQIKISGNVIVTAPQITITERASLSNIQIYAKGIHIQSGFQGNLQVFGSDSILIDSNVHLSYPSAIVLSSADDWGKFILEKESSIEGAVIVDQKLIRSGNKSLCYSYIAPRSEIIGTVIVSENLDLQGSVTGCVCTGNFKLITGGSVYENYLLDATIQNNGLSSQYAMPLAQKRPVEYIEIKTMELQ